MQPEDFRPDDLFAQIQGLVDGLEAERRAREAAESSDKAKTELLAMVGHELRTPMETIIAMSELLLSSPLDPTQQNYTQTLTQSARSLLGVLDDVLDFSRLETGSFELQYAPLDLHDLVHGVAAEMQTQANEKALTSGVDIGANCPRFVIGDAARIRQVLTGMIDNALKTTAEGSVRLHTSAGDAGGQLTLRFDVTDTGRGLSKAERERMFEPAAAANGAIEGRSGSGLGLSIARKLSVVMGGEVGCDSKLGQGSVYWFTLPAERAPDETVAAQVREPLPHAPLAGHVLVVEDNAVNRMLIGAYLEEFGLTYEMIDNSAAAIVALAENDYDLVLVDTAMPDLDGVETARRIRSLHGPASKLPIVALVAQAQRSYCGNYLSAGMDTYVLKPIRGRELHAALAPFLTPSAEPMIKLVKG